VRELLVTGWIGFTVTKAIALFGEGAVGFDRGDGIEINNPEVLEIDWS
jgi:hypothetical protein